MRNLTYIYIVLFLGFICVLIYSIDIAVENKRLETEKNDLEEKLEKNNAFNDPKELATTMTGLLKKLL